MPPNITIRICPFCPMEFDAGLIAFALFHVTKEHPEEPESSAWMRLLFDLAIEQLRLRRLSGTTSRL